MDEKDFQEKILKGAEEVKERVEKGLTEVKDQVEEIGEEAKAVATKAETLVKDYDRLDKTTKGMFEDVTKLKKVANDQQANAETLVRTIKQLQDQLRNEVRGAFGNPVQRIQKDEELRKRFNCAVRLAVDKGGDMMRRCEPMIKDLSTVEKAIGEDSGVGATLIDDRLANEIYDTLSTFGVWNTFAVRRLGTKQTKFPVKTVRPIANFVLTEAGTIGDDANKAGTSVTLEVEVIGVLLNVSIQLLEDSEYDVTADILDDFAEAYANRLDVAALTADGTADATNGGMTGIFQGGTLVAATAGEPTVDLLDLEEFTGCLLATDPIVLNRPSKWWMHPWQLIRMLSIKDSQGRPLFQTAMEAPSQGSIGSLLGYPIVFAFAAPSANTANTRVATWGDPNGQVVGIRRDFAFESSDHHRWNTFERSFRGVGRAGTKIRRALAFANLRTTT